MSRRAEVAENAAKAAQEGGWDTTPCSTGTKTHVHTHQCSGVIEEGLTTLCLRRSERNVELGLEG